MKVRPVFGKGSGNAFPLGVIGHSFPIFDVLRRNDVKIWTKFNSGTHKDTDDLYRVTMHELAHVSHFISSPVNSVLSIGIVNESWAECIEYYFTLPYYPNVVSGIPDQSRASIVGTGGDDWKYTPFFIDLRDDTNQRDDNGGSIDWADDDVSGFTLYQMLKALDNRTTLDGICTHLKRNYRNPTENELDNLVRFYNDIRDNH